MTAATMLRMGAGTRFVPSTISGLQLWLKADAITGLVDSAAVGTWPDSSGLGNTATQATAGNKPTYKTAIVNGRPVVRFDGGDSLGSAVSAALKPTTVLAVVKVTDFATARTIHGCTDNAGLQLRVETNGKLGALQMGITLLGFSTGAISAATWTVIGFTYSATGVYAFYRNGTMDGTGTNDQTFFATGTQIGTREAVSEFLLGDLAELLVYDTVLSVGDLQAVETYLGSKYAITVS